MPLNPDFGHDDEGSYDYAPGDYHEMAEGPPPWDRQGWDGEHEAAMSEAMAILPPAPDENLKVKVTIEDEGGNELWLFYPLGRTVKVGEHVRLDFDIKWELS